MNPSDTYGERRPLGQILLEQASVTGEQLRDALSLQQTRHQRLGELLCQLGHLDAVTLRQALVTQAHLPRYDPETMQITPEALAAVPAEVSFRYKVLPFALQDRSLLLAMADPFDRAAAEAVRVLTGRRVERYYCPEEELLDAARRVYGSTVARMIADLKVEVDAAEEDEAQLTGQLQEMAREPSIVNLVNLILLEALEARASDVHVEPFEKALKVKYRIDGILHEVSPPPKHLQPAIVSRVKIMAGMNIAERFVPQDGHIAFAGPHGPIDLRVATVPTVYGECVAMRILDRTVSLISLERLGMNPQGLSLLVPMLDRPHGIVLVTGPTGSGKTTTLYAALNKIYTPAKKIITIEDPVEYQLEGINQIPVNRKRGVDFANGLRAILRQDPDVIMVGEIRDRETADIAIRSALTGHLVFSTLHTNDAPGAVARMLDMGVEPYLLASSLEGVLAQRLVRTICPHCRREHGPEVEILERMGHRVSNGSGGQFFRGEGCRQCRQTGYIGRTGIFELLRITSSVRTAILRRGSTTEVVAAAPPDHQPMREDGFCKACEGITTLEEVLRVTQDTQVDNGT